MNPIFDIGLHHFLLVSIALVGAGVATVLTKRNAIGILIGVELILNAAAVNFVAFNHYRFESEVNVATSADTAPTGASVVVAGSFSASELAPSSGLVLTDIRASGSEPVFLRMPAVHGMVFSIFIIVLAAAEAAVALAIFLNFYNNFSSIDVEKADELRG